MAAIADLQALGYDCGYAHGSVQVEQDALDVAQAEAAPAAITEKAGTITKSTLDDLANMGALPDTAAERQALAMQIAAAALDMVEQHTTEKVEFHQAALAIAQASPDVWVISQTVDGQVVVELYVACKEDGTGWDGDSQAALDALADKTAFAARVAQIRNPPPPVKAKG